MDYKSIKNQNIRLEFLCNVFWDLLTFLFNFMMLLQEEGMLQVSEIVYF